MRLGRIPEHAGGLNLEWLTAWYLARAWPEGRLTFIPDAGHKGSLTARELIEAALDGFSH